MLDYISETLLQNLASKSDSGRKVIVEGRGVREIAVVDARGFERAQVPLHQEEVVTQN